MSLGYALGHASKLVLAYPCNLMSFEEDDCGADLKNSRRSSHSFYQSGMVFVIYL